MSRYRLSCWLACVLPALGSCGESASPGSTNQYIVEWGAAKVAPGTERSRCVVKRLGNTIPIRVNVIETSLGPTSHHLLVYRETDREESQEPFECVSFIDALNAHFAPMFISQKAEDVVSLPPGVAFTIQPDELIRLELHYLNTTDREQTASARVVFHALPEEDYVAEANFFFIGTPDVLIRPFAEETLGPVYFPMPEGFEDAKFFAITGHQHRQGTGVEVDVVEGPDAVGKPVYDVPQFLWFEPKTVYHDPAFSVPKGGGFRFTCNWNNQSDQTLRYGGSSLDEMCMFWTYYYPSQGTKVCFHTELPLPFDSCCPGAPGCGVVF